MKSVDLGRKDPSWHLQKRGQLELAPQFRSWPPKILVVLFSGQQLYTLAYKASPPVLTLPLPDIMKAMKELIKPRENLQQPIEHIQNTNRTLGDDT
jgi:hypothetical protein